jgi:hypothetical protein
MSGARIARAGVVGGGRWAGGRWAGGRWNGGRWHGDRWWPYWAAAGVGVGLAAWPYYGGYGYDDCIQWGPDWGWVNVCQYPYGGYYPY